MAQFIGKLEACSFYLSKRLHVSGRSLFRKSEPIHHKELYFMFRNQCVGMRKLQVERAESKCIDATENGGRENNCTGNEMRNNDTNRIQRQRQQSHERMNTTIKCKSRKEKNQYQMHGAKANSAMQLLECEYIGCVSVLYSCLVMKLVCHFSSLFVCDSANELKQSSYHVFRAFTSSSCSSLYFPFHHVSSTI